MLVRLWQRLTPVGKFFVLAFLAAVLYGMYLVTKPYHPIVGNTISRLVNTVSQGPASQTPGAQPATSIPGVVPTAPIVTGPTTQLPQVVVGFDAFASYYNVILIEQLELDKKYGFDLVLLPFCSTDENCYTEDERSEALRSGSWDAMLTTLDKLALNPDIGKLTVLVDETDGADKIVVNPTVVATLNDLRGKKIAYMEGSVGEFYTYYLLNLVRIGPNEVELFPSEDVVAATDLYVNGWVDAVSGWEPDVDAAVESGGNIIIDSGTLRVVVDVLLFSNQAIATKPETVRAFHNAWFEALKLQSEEPSRAEQLVISWGLNDWSYVAAEGDLVGWLETIAQAGIGANALAMANPSLLTDRLKEAQVVWQWAGKSVPGADLSTLVDPSFVLAAAENPSLFASQAPINDSFLLAGRPDVPQLSEDQLGGATILAVLPLRKIEFEPDSVRLTEQAQSDLREQVMPVLRSSTELYLRIDGSAAWPGPSGRYSEEQIRKFAYSRALAVAQFLAGQGIDPDRLVLGTTPSKYPNSVEEEELEQDRFVQFILIEPLGR